MKETGFNKSEMIEEIRKLIKETFPERINLVKEAGVWKAQSTGKRKAIQMTLHNKNFQVLVDTGAEFSLLRADVFSYSFARKLEVLPSHNGVSATEYSIVV